MGQRSWFTSAEHVSVCDLLRGSWGNHATYQGQRKTWKHVYIYIYIHVGFDSTYKKKTNIFTCNSGLVLTGLNCGLNCGRATAFVKSLTNCLEKKLWVSNCCILFKKGVCVCAVCAFQIVNWNPASLPLQSQDISYHLFIFYFKILSSPTCLWAKCVFPTVSTNVKGERETKKKSETGSNPYKCRCSGIGRWWVSGGNLS